uniref:Putative secreted protein n=1 Tax=Anopheles triannulatus TaxID=58253 RepID=A0A2M4B4F1_9DIPT
MPPLTTTLVLMLLPLPWLFRCSSRGDASGVALCRVTSSPSCCGRTSSLGTLRPPLCVVAGSPQNENMEKKKRNGNCVPLIVFNKTRDGILLQ